MVTSVEQASRVKLMETVSRTGSVDGGTRPIADKSIATSSPNDLELGPKIIDEPDIVAAVVGNNHPGRPNQIDTGIGDAFNGRGWLKP